MADGSLLPPELIPTAPRCQSLYLNNAAIFLFANLGTNICLRCKQALTGSVINRIIKQTVMSWITANYDKICFGICLRGVSEVLKSTLQFITPMRSHLSKQDEPRVTGGGGEGRRVSTDNDTSAAPGTPPAPHSHRLNTLGSETH